MMSTFWNPCLCREAMKVCKTRLIPKKLGFSILASRYFQISFCFSPVRRFNL